MYRVLCVCGQFLKRDILFLCLLDVFTVYLYHRIEMHLICFVLVNKEMTNGYEKLSFLKEWAFLLFLYQLHSTFTQRPNQSEHFLCFYY